MPNVKIYSTKVCPYCVAAKGLFDRLKVEYEEIRLDGNPELRNRLSEENGGWRTVPMIFINGKFMGGFTDVSDLHRAGKLLPLLGKNVAGL